MGTVIEFPAGSRAATAPRLPEQDAGMVIILPVVRVEREPADPSGDVDSGAGAATGRKRRRRATRS